MFCSARFLRRLSRKVGLVAFVMTVGVALLTGSSAYAAQENPQSPSQQRPQVTTEVVFERGTLRIGYSGPVVAGMADFIATEFKKYRDVSHKLQVYINSGGGSIEEGEQVIEVLRAIRQTHRLETIVKQGWTCASMCVPIFLQGKDRFAAGSSLWVFHHATNALNQDGSKVAIDTEETVRLFRRYYLEAGVPAAWIKGVLAKIAGGKNYWQTGKELMESDSGVVTYPISDVTERPEATPEPRRPQPHTAK